MAHHLSWSVQFCEQTRLPRLHHRPPRLSVVAGLRTTEACIRTLSAQVLTNTADIGRCVCLPGARGGMQRADGRSRSAGTPHQSSFFVISDWKLCLEDRSDAVDAV